MSIKHYHASARAFNAQQKNNQTKPVTASTTNPQEMQEQFTRFLQVTSDTIAHCYKGLTVYVDHPSTNDILTSLNRSILCVESAKTMVNNLTLVEPQMRSAQKRLPTFRHKSAFNPILALALTPALAVASKGMQAYHEIFRQLRGPSPEIGVLADMLARVSDNLFDFLEQILAATKKIKASRDPERLRTVVPVLENIFETLDDALGHLFDAMGELHTMRV